jgi:hypothetical protein
MDRLPEDAHRGARVRHMQRILHRGFARPHVDFLLGTFLPFARASESPMAIACFLLLTVFPLLPLLSLPALRRSIAPLTSLDADFEYRAMIFSY